MGSIVFIEHPVEVKNAKPQAKFVLRSLSDCTLLLDLLDKYPLRSKKARDLSIWRKAVEIKQKFFGNWEQQKEAGILGIATELKEVRAYK